MLVPASVLHASYGSCRVIWLLFAAQLAQTQPEPLPPAAYAPRTPRGRKLAAGKTLGSSKPSSKGLVFEAAQATEIGSPRF